MPLWWNWQTRGTQNPVVAIPCRFDPDQRHHNKKRQVFACLFLLWYRLRGDVRGNSLAVARQFACKFLPRVPVYGIRQSPKGTDRHHIIFGYNGNRYFSEQVFTCLFCYGADCEGTYAATCLPSLVNLLANFCRGFPFTGFGNPRRIATGENLSFFVMIPTARGRTRHTPYSLFLQDFKCRRSSICLQILAEGSRLRDTAIPCGYRPASHNIRIQR